MLLRRITQHVKTQNWFAVFVDFLIVVVGIFVGLQVQEWNENRVNRAEAEEYRQRLITDMELSVIANQNQIDQGNLQVAGMNVILTSLDECELPEAQRTAFATGLFQMGKYNMPAMLTGTLDELNATGHFPLLGDVELRRQVTDAFRYYERVFAIEPQITGRALPSINYVRQHVRFDMPAHRFTDETVQPDEVRYNFDEICNDRRFLNAVATVRELTMAVNVLTQAIIDDQNGVIRALEASLHNDPD